MVNQNIRVSTQWEHSITNLLGHEPTTKAGIALRQWVLHQGSSLRCATRFHKIYDWPIPNFDNEY